MAIGNFEKLWHIPEDLEDCSHVQGYAHDQGCPWAWEDLSKEKKPSHSLLTDPEVLSKQEVKDKANSYTAWGLKVCFKQNLVQKVGRRCTVSRQLRTSEPSGSMQPLKYTDTGWTLGPVLKIKTRLFFFKASRELREHTVENIESTD